MVKRRKLSKKRKIFAIVVVIFVLLILAFDVRLKTVNYILKTSKVDENIRLAVITDLHSCYYGKGQRTLIDAVEKEKPDVILLGGDIYDDRLPDENTDTFLKAIGRKYPCFYVTGNHECWSERVHEMLEKIESHGIYIFHGETENIEIKGERINISGVDDPDMMYILGEDESMEKQLENTKTNKKKDDFSVLLAHRPVLIDQYLKYDFDVVFTGHAHGGQWRIPLLLNGVLAPDEGLFPEYAGGDYEFSNGKMIVSRGLARESTKIPRIFNRPELVIVDIVSNK